jgi:hypothetical protein
MALPPMRPKLPPTYRRFAESAASARTALLFTVVVQPGTSAPVSAVTATSRLRAVPPTVVKVPPRKTLLPSEEAANAYTMPSVDGFQVGSSVPSVRIAATFARGAPATVVNCPPM